MKRNGVFIDQETQKLKRKIHRTIPNAGEVELKVDKNQSDQYETHVSVRIPPRQTLIASKKDKSLKVSLEKTKQAILRQLQKLKTRRSPINQL
jgi:ribosome-associated translation inhibitor RaiA